MPHIEAGPRMAPPVSEPSAPAQRPAATATPEPEEEPARARGTSRARRPARQRTPPAAAGGRRGGPARLFPGVAPGGKAPIPRGGPEGPLVHGDLAEHHPPPRVQPLGD